MKTIGMIWAGVGLLAITGCSTAIQPYKVPQAETGVMARVEAATIVSATPVSLTGLDVPRFGRTGRGAKGRGVILVLRIERNNDLVSVTQGDDGRFAVGASVWVQFGDRIRVVPR